jgi:AMMECR1 domain-containing protein
LYQDLLLLAIPCSVNILGKPVPFFSGENEWIWEREVGVDGRELVEG